METLKILEGAKALQQVKKITPIWSASAIGCLANKEVIQTIANLPNIAYIKWDKPLPPEDIFDGSLVSTNSPMYSTSSTAEIQWPVDHINAPAAWDSDFTGKGVLVGILDPHVDYTHSDLKDSLWNGSICSYRPPGEELLQPLEHHGWDIIDNDNDPI